MPWYALQDTCEREGAETPTQTCLEEGNSRGLGKSLHPCLQGEGPWEGAGKQDVRFGWVGEQGKPQKPITTGAKHSLLRALSLNPGSHEDFLSTFPCDSDPALNWVPPQRNTLEPCPARCGPSHPRQPVRWNHPHVCSLGALMLQYLYSEHTQGTIRLRCWVLQKHRSCVFKGRSHSKA